ncbi:hypothetical protein N7527_006481 [Penicillium freii]|nr:hypothetical protein N7527_006481 [Penicillium freii]
MAGRAAMRTPEPPDRDEPENSPPRLSRPKRTTRPPRNYAQEQEIDNEQRKTQSQQKKRTEPESQPDRATSDESATESNDLDVNNLVKEIAKLRREIRLRDELHKEELQKAKAEFGAALAENGHDKILREIQSLREEISAPALIGSPSYADVARTPPLSHPSNIRSLSTSNTIPTTFTDTLYCTIDTSMIVEKETERISAGSIRAVVETEIRATEDHIHWRCRAVTMDPKNTNRIRIACRDEAEYQLVNVNKAAVLDNKDKIRAGAAAAFSEENEATVTKIAWLSKKESAKVYRSMIVYLTKGSNVRRLLADGFFYTRGESGVTSTFEHRPRPIQYYNCQEIGHKAF